MHTTWLRNSLGLKHRLRQASETITSKAGESILGLKDVRVKQVGENKANDHIETTRWKEKRQELSVRWEKQAWAGLLGEG